MTNKIDTKDFRKKEASPENILS